MNGRKLRIVIGASALAAAAVPGSGAAAQTPVGSLCNGSGKIEVFTEVSSIACVGDPEREMKALFKARSEYQGMFGLAPEKKAQIDARIERRIRELRKIKAARANVAARGEDALPTSTR
jgi:hypothetical protein